MYNYELSSLEIVGDYWASYTAEVNTNHYRMSDVGIFSQVYELFSPLQYGSLVYVETVGTLCIGGYNNTGVYSTQIITQNRAWPKIFYYDHLLASYDSDAGYLWLGVTSNQNVVFTAGGYGNRVGYTNLVQTRGVIH